MIIIIVNFLKRNKIIIISFIILVIIFLSIFINKNNETEASSLPMKSDETITTTEPEPVIEVVNDITVEIKGAVLNPGVYTLKENSRVIDLINQAGGLVENANTDYINQSKILTDQMVVKIYTNQEIKDANKVEVVTKYIEKECNCPKITNDACLDNTSENQNTTSNGLVNINTCTKEELLTLPGIGESKAISIMEYRKTNKFNSIEDIKNVSGIGDSLYDKIKDHIEV